MMSFMLKLDLSFQGPCLGDDTLFGEERWDLVRGGGKEHHDGAG
jgi:hypothetical protein